MSSQETKRCPHGKEKSSPSPCWDCLREYVDAMADMMNKSSSSPSVGAEPSKCRHCNANLQEYYPAELHQFHVGRKSLTVPLMCEKRGADAEPVGASEAGEPMLVTCEAIPDVPHVYCGDGRYIPAHKCENFKRWTLGVAEPSAESEGSVTKFCGKQLCAVAGGGYLYCDQTEGHAGSCSKTFPMQFPHTTGSMLVAGAATGETAEESRAKFDSKVSDVRESLFKSDMHYHGSTLASFRDGSGMHTGVFDLAEVIAGYLVEADRRAASLISERDEARRAKEHTHDWYARHYGKLEDWARKRLPEPWRGEFFNCVANGTWGHDDVGEPYMTQVGRIVPSGYFVMDDAAKQLLNDQTVRAEKAEAERDEARKELARLKAHE